MYRFERPRLTREVFITAARAAIATVVILLSTADPLALAWQRFAGTAVGAVIGALVATYLGRNWVVYGASIFLCGMASALLGLGAAYRFAAITLSIVVLIPRDGVAWPVRQNRG
jgi:uncharacterized membrane protein YgaE (UPF0421/DUF939 family)